MQSKNFCSLINIINRIKISGKTILLKLLTISIKIMNTSISPVSHQYYYFFIETWAITLWFQGQIWYFQSQNQFAGSMLHDHIKFRLSYFIYFRIALYYSIYWFVNYKMLHADHLSSAQLNHCLSLLKPFIIQFEVWTYSKAMFEVLLALPVTTFSVPQVSPFSSYNPPLFPRRTY